MTFGPATIVRPGATRVVAAVGSRGLTGAPGQDGAPGTVGPAPTTNIQVWASGRTYLVGPPADYVAAPAASTYFGGSYICQSPHTAGDFDGDVAKGLWRAATLRGAQGAPGTPGSTWYSGSGTPAAAIGVAGDYFFRTDTYDVLIKASGAWAAIANLKGLAGNTVASGQGAPAASVGANGDFYLDTSAYAMWGPKVNGAWPSSGVSIIGPKGKDGTGAGTVINNGTAAVGDVAIFDAADGTRIKSGGRLGFVIVDTPSSPYTALNRDEVWWNTASAAAVLLLPANPVAGNRVKALRFGANTVTVQANGNPIYGLNGNDLLIDQDKSGAELVWDVALAAWVVIFIQHG